MRVLPFVAATLLAGVGLSQPTPAAWAAPAAAPAVDVWLTTTSDSGGRTVTRGLQKQTPISFADGTGSGQVTIGVDESRSYQQFEGAGASFTDTAAWLMNSSGALSQATRDATMRKLYDPVDGIGLSFVRNPMGASDLARFGYSYDDVPAGQTDPDLAGFSLDHDLADVLPLTRQARQLNPALKVMASPWTAPAWMKDSGSLNGGWLKAEYYPAYARYFVKYLQAYAERGVPVDYVSVQNEPTCCAGYPSMSWNGNGLWYFTKTNLLPALASAGQSAKVLALDWNWDTYDGYAAQTLDDAAIRSHPNFGGIAWHGYGGDVRAQSTVHDRYPDVKAYDTEHSGGTWIGDQHREDMANIVDYTRNWGRTVTKWSLAVDQNMGPHNGGCGTCTGLITVHNGDSRHGQVDYTVEYYTLGHLTKFVKPGATRIDSNDSSAVRNVAWRNPDGSKALVAHNASGANQNVRVNWGGQSFSYDLPARTSATFTWAGNPTQGGDRVGAITGSGGRCAAAAGTANGSAVQTAACDGSAGQRWTVGSDGGLRAHGKCLDVVDRSTADGAKLQLWDCTGDTNQRWVLNAAGDIVNPAADKCVDITGNSTANGVRLQLWTCTGAANQKWSGP